MVADQGVKTIITIGGQRRGMPYEQAADNAVAFLNRIKGHLEDRGITLAIENMNNRRLDPNFGREDQTFGRWAWGVGVCERVNSPNVKLVCDLYHLQIMDGDIAQNIRDTIQWIAHFHTAGVPSRNEIDFSQEMNYRYIAEVIATCRSRATSATSGGRRRAAIRCAASRKPSRSWTSRIATRKNRIV